MNAIFLRNCLASLALSGLFCLPAAGAEDGKKHKLSQWRFGKVLFGERISKSNLKGKVVLIENWGVRCPPCVAAMPHLAELDRQHRDAGLVIIGAECQGHGKDDIKPIIEKANAEFVITERCEGPIEFSAIPRCHIFGRDGILVYDGLPRGPEFEEAVRTALEAGGDAGEAEAEKSGEPLIPSRSWTNAEGKTITAAVKAIDGTSVVFVLPNGKEVTYPLDKLSDESRGELEKAAKKENDGE